MEYGKRYIGIFNYRANDLSLTKMIDFDASIKHVAGTIVDHAGQNGNSISQYHISEYMCENWNTEHSSLPVKVKEYSVEEAIGI